MAFITPSEAQRVCGDLMTLAELLGLEVLESNDFPTIMIKVSVGGKSVAITKQGSDFLATDILPSVPSTFVGGTMFKHRLDI
jgi:hypothetical protein